VTDHATAPLAPSILEALGKYDTPTICNALEVVAPYRRLIGFTTRPLVCPFPDLPPIVGYARTATIRATAASGLPLAEQQAQRLAYYNYVGTGIGPRISVIQDLDGPDAGFGAFWARSTARSIRRSAASVSSPMAPSASSRNGRRISRRWPARSGHRMRMSMSPDSAKSFASPA
jgi:hypothetical protein